MNPQAATDVADWPRFEPRLRSVVEHVYAHLDEPLDLMTLADIAHLSPHHWHRVYHALCGETMAATLKRLRLHRAAGWLANTGLPVDQVARQSRYPNLPSFTRLFKDVYGLPPARYRAAGQHTEFAGLARGEPCVAHPVQIRALPAAECAVLVHTGPYASMGAACRWLFGDWLEQSGREPADAPVVEEYMNSPRDTAPADLVTHIHLPLRAQ